MKRMLCLVGLLAACSEEAPQSQQDAAVVIDLGNSIKDSGTQSQPDIGQMARDAGRIDSGVEIDAGSNDQTPPVITFTSPRSGRMSPARMVWVTGTVSDDLQVAGLAFLQGAGMPQLVDLDEQGHFELQVSLTPGQNTLRFGARDEAGNETLEELSIYFGHRIGAGNSQAMMLKANTLITWGRNELGQLANGTLEGSRYGDDPQTMMLPLRYTVQQALVSVVTRQTFALGLDSQGQVYTWGSNSKNQLGYATASDCGSRGTSSCGRSPQPVPGVSSIVGIAAGYEHVLVLDQDGTVQAWGNNQHGQLGRMTAESSTSAVATISGLQNVIQLAAGTKSSFALTRDGKVYAWGENDQAQLGQGAADRTPHPEPMEVPGVQNAVSIAAANDTVYALLRDGTVLSWGQNHRGQAGIGSTDNPIQTPSLVVTQKSGQLETLRNVENVAGDGFIGMVSTREGKVYTFGMGSLGQLGQGYLDGGERDLENRNYASPVPVTEADRALFNAVEIEVGAGGPALVLTPDGNLFGWGWSFRGSLGLEGAIDAWAYSAPILILGN